MSQNFWKPRSLPNPASVTTRSASFRATRSSMIELFACAMLPNGPACRKTGWCSSVWTRFGSIASRITTVIAPATWSCSAVTGSPSNVDATTIRPRRARRSCRSDASARIAMISEAAVITNSFSRGIPWAFPPSPITVRRSSRSFTSSVRGHVIVCGSIPSGLPWKIEASSAAARRLCAAVTAWKSPLRWRLIASIGTTCA